MNARDQVPPVRSKPHLARVSGRWSAWHTIEAKVYEVNLAGLYAQRLNRRAAIAKLQSGATP